MFSIGIIGFVLIGMFAFHPMIMDQIKVFVAFQLIPMDVVFDEGIDLKQYDGGVILNCLRDKNFCPEGVHYKDDVTGEVFPSNPNQQKTFQPYTPPEDPNAPPDPSLFPDVQDKITFSDNASLVIFGILIVSLIGVLVWVFKLRRKPKIVP